LTDGFPFIYADCPKGCYTKSALHYYMEEAREGLLLWLFYQELPILD